MTAGRCTRSFEAEAMRDGRLGDAERASFERHLATCAACAREVESLETLAGALRARTERPADELHVRRERTRLLAAFDRALVTPERARIPPGVVGSVAAIAVLAAALVVFVWGRLHTVPAPRSTADVRAEPEAVWSEHQDGDLERIQLVRGKLWVHVSHTTGGGRLVIELPDGELEDIGTTFAVQAADGRTARVTVDEGRVVLRLRGKPSVTLGAGDTWSPDLPAPVACASAPPLLPEPPPTAQPLPVPSGTRPVRPSLPAGAMSSAAGAVSSALPPDVSGDFRSAMDALDRGDDREAARAFGDFVARHSQDPRAEDAAYLRVIALQRSGDAAATRAAAAEYLRRYPAGFRRSEVDRLAR
jgi:anti-sigma factor ChrR (cupin superfamily)